MPLLLDIRWDNMHQFLMMLYDEMMPLCRDLLGIARGIGGIGAIFYIANRVWRHMVNNESINFYPLFRPFVIAFCIGIFPLVLGTINGILKPIVTITTGMVQKQNTDVAAYTKRRNDIERANYNKAGKLYADDDDAQHDKRLKELGIFVLASTSSMTMERMAYKIKKNFRDYLKELLDFLYQAISLVIDALRTFFLIIISIIGPISFGLSIFEGFQSTLTHWLMRYIQVFLWLPIANIFGTLIGKLQVMMLQKAIDDLRTNALNSTFDSSDIGYMIFMLIAIIGYASVPTVAGYVVRRTGDQTA